MKFPTKFSYIDRTGRVVIEASVYKRARTFSEELALIRSQKGLFGFIDKTGKFIIKPQFIEAFDFSDSLARVKLPIKTGIIYDDLNKYELLFVRSRLGEKSRNSKEQSNWGYINKQGKLVIETDFDTIFDFSEGVAVARKGNEVFFIDKDGRIVFTFKKDKVEFAFDHNLRFSEGLITAWDVKTCKCGFMDKTGKFVIEPKFNNCARFSEGLARVSIKKSDREYLGFINRRGEFAIPAIFDLDSNFTRNSTDFSEGLAGVIDSPPTMTRNPKFIYINTDGKIALQTKFFLAEPFHEDLAVVYDDKTDKYGYIDKLGKIALPLQYYMAGRFSEGLALVAY